MSLVRGTQYLLNFVVVAGNPVVHCPLRTSCCLWIRESMLAECVPRVTECRSRGATAVRPESFYLRNPCPVAKIVPRLHMDHTQAHISLQRQYAMPKFSDAEFDADPNNNNALGMLNSSKHWLDTASHLLRTSADKLQPGADFGFPLYFLIMHGLEGTLKCFIHARGIPERDRKSVV